LGGKRRRKFGNEGGVKQGGPRKTKIRSRRTGADRQAVANQTIAVGGKIRSTNCRLNANSISGNTPQKKERMWGRKGVSGFTGQSHIICRSRKLTRGCS